jgi:hypothetical protein
MSEVIMQVNEELARKISEAVKTLMRIEGYQADSSPQIKARAKALLERQREQVRLSRK